MYTRVKPGDRVRMTGIMRDDPAPIPVGTEGTVVEVLNPDHRLLTQIAVDWDDDRSLMLLPQDPFEVLR